MTHRLNGSEIQAGDTVTFTSGKTAQVVGTRPYEGPLVDLLGEGSQIATVWVNGHHTEMTLEAVCYFAVDRAA